MVEIREYDRPMSSDDTETAQTIRYMDELATADANDPAVYNATCEALEHDGLNWQSDPAAIAQAIYWFLKRTVRYVPTPGTSPLVDQTLIAPTAVLAMPEPIGDCPQFSMLAAAMFRVCCIPTCFVTIAAEATAPDLWSHVYNSVEVRPGVYMPFDSSNGPAPGAEYAKPYKRRVWPSLTPHPCRGKETASQMVRTAKANADQTGMRHRMLRRGLGDVECDSDGNCYDSGTLVENTGPAPDLIAPGTYANGYSDPYAPGGALNPIGSSAGSNGPSLFSTLLTDAASIGSSLVRASTAPKPYYVTGANGQQTLFNPATGAAVPLASSISPTVLLFGVLGIGAFALLSSRGK